jgi:hypothetical protein
MGVSGSGKGANGGSILLSAIAAARWRWYSRCSILGLIQGVVNNFNLMMRYGYKVMDEVE